MWSVILNVSDNTISASELTQHKMRWKDNDE